MRLPRLLRLLSLGWILPASISAIDRPNILWITSEDNGPQLGCYGDAYADTPSIDALAERGMIYLHCWSNAPVCAPARTTLISGVYPPCTGSQHMRSNVAMPGFMKMYPQLLREAGYYCTNNRKEDYNLEKPGKVWDESSNKAHWKNRAAGQPFFAIFNHTVSHESQIRKRPHRPVHDPAKVRVPAYHPDTPSVRRDWAQYYDKLTEMDRRVGENLRELEEAGLAGDTIVFYYGDHGSGMPRSKRWPYNSGLHVPLVIHVPEKFRDLAAGGYVQGGKSDRLVSFADLAPTVLSLAGLEPPSWMQGRAFLGPHEAAPRDYYYGFRGRMDERYDMVRTVGDGRFVYLRHYHPHRIYGQHVDYMFQTPTTREWRRLYDEGALDEAQRQFWEPKPAEALYDLESDPDEVRNLAGVPEHAERLKAMRAAQEAWAREIRDLGYLPEAEIHARSAGTTPYEMGHGEGRYDLPRIMETANWAASGDAQHNGALAERLGDDDSAVRYWAAMGFLQRGREAMGEGVARALEERLHDPSPSVRIPAAEVLVRFGPGNARGAALKTLLDCADGSRHGLFVALAALNAIDELDALADPVIPELETLPEFQPGKRLGNYVPRVVEKILADRER